MYIYILLPGLYKQRKWGVLLKNRNQRERKRGWWWLMAYLEFNGRQMEKKKWTMISFRATAHLWLILIQDDGSHFDWIRLFRWWWWSEPRVTVCVHPGRRSKCDRLRIGRPSCCVCKVAKKEVEWQAELMSYFLLKAPAQFFFFFSLLFPPVAAAVAAVISFPKPAPVFRPSQYLFIYILSGRDFC